MSQDDSSLWPLTWPRWLQEVTRSVVVRSQIILSGNIRDGVLLTDSTGSVVRSVHQCLWQALSRLGYEGILCYDRIDGVCLYPDLQGPRSSLAEFLGLPSLGDSRHASLEQFQGMLRNADAAQSKERHRFATLVDYASRLAANPMQLQHDVHSFFVACEKLSHDARAYSRSTVPGDPPLYNVVIWLVNQENDLPPWFVSGNERVRAHQIPTPDMETRQAVIGTLCPRLKGFDDEVGEKRLELMRAFAYQTEGLPLNSLTSIIQLALREGVPFAEVDDAVLLYKIGVANSPWKAFHIKDSVRKAKDDIGERVKGQEAAVSDSLDILKRSILGLSGAQMSRRSGRPKGVLFFAGPTGVGKTELAKALTEVLFGRGHEPVRFDMSEFAAEHSDARLLGAPPGYVGYDAGGQLTEAVRARPFSVLLFDEIEKAHPRILDKFLQILEDGRLTDGAGNTVYFSEAVIIFTSNKGIYEDELDREGRPTGRRRLTVGPKGWRCKQCGLTSFDPPFVGPCRACPSEDGDSVLVPFDEIKKRVVVAIQRYFKEELERPELLNRIGENLVVFNFIDETAAGPIFAMMLDNVKRRVAQERKIPLTISAPLEEKLRRWCVEDLSLGARNIGNVLESRLVNPLARHLFDTAPPELAVLELTDIIEANGVYTVIAK